MNTEFRGCKISIQNKSKTLSDDGVFNFCKKYIEYYLAQEGSFIPEVVERQEDLVIILYESKKHYFININDTTHIILNRNGFHNAQIGVEQFSASHGAFFMQIHSHKVSAVNIIENYPF
ncbi:hypothetical protein [Pontimicrobium sp. MEBiC06410]